MPLAWWVTAAALLLAVIFTGALCRYGAEAYPAFLLSVVIFVAVIALRFHAVGRAEMFFLQTLST